MNPPCEGARSVADVTELLDDPAGETPSFLTGDPLVIVDLDGEARGIAERLHGRPCVSIGIHRRGSHLPSHVEGFDVLVTATGAPPRPWVRTSDDVVDRITESVSANPRAAISLVQLLRMTEGLQVGDALVAESAVYSMLLAGPEFQSWLAARRARHAAPDDEPVRVERTHDRLIISLSRPHVHNAYSVAMRDELASALAIAVADVGIAEIVLRGDGKSFCSGGDLTEFGTAPEPATAHLVRATRSPARLLAQLSARVVAEVHGACVGAGIELAAFAGRLGSTSDAWFCLPELRMGLVPGAGGTVSLPRRIGRHRTAALALSGMSIDAHQAREWGLVDELSTERTAR